MASRRSSISQSGSRFFGLTPEDRSNVFTQIHEIVFHGKGGYSWADVYNMPIWLRRFTFLKIKEFYEKQQEEQENYEKKLKNKTTASPMKPNVTPTSTYTTKAPTRK